MLFISCVVLVMAAILEVIWARQLVSSIMATGALTSRDTGIYAFGRRRRRDNRCRSRDVDGGISRRKSIQCDQDAEARCNRATRVIFL